MKVAQCSSCHAEIIWALTERGKRMPVDANPVPAGGNVTLQDNGSGSPIAVYAKGPVPGPRYLSHFVTCPSANKHRKPKVTA